MPDLEEGQQNTSPNPDLFAQLLTAAAERAAQDQAEDALKKGFVTREQINQALTTFGEQMEASIVEKITQALLPQVQDAVKKAEAVAVGKKSTILAAEDERDADPIAYIIKKGREQGAESYDDTEKRIIWDLTHRAL